jgi:hypothetical protein
MECGGPSIDLGGKFYLAIEVETMRSELLEWIKRIRDDRENGLRMTQRDQATHLIEKWRTK